MKRGEIYYADLGRMLGSEQSGVRPVLIVQNNTGNQFSPTVIVAPITSKMMKKRLPTHVYLQQNQEQYGLDRASVVLTEQVRTVDKQRMKWFVGALDEMAMKRVDRALAISFGMYPDSRDMAA